MIHFSGTLISDLLWSDPETIDILRQGIADGQFEIVGSTYAQNIVYSTRSSADDFQQNQHQIAIHKSLIQSALRATPVSFWNPERVWTQNIVRLLADNAYSNVQIEDHILAESGITGSEYAVRTTTYEGRTVNVFNDDKDFEGRVNGAIDSGDTSGVMSFLRDLYDADQNDQYAVCYHEDMEATGLWDYEGGNNPQGNFSNLGKLLTAFERDPRIKVTTYSEFLQTHQPVEDVTPVVDGAADWMGRDAWFAEDINGDAVEEIVVAAAKGLLLQFTDPPASVAGEEDVFGLEVNPRWQMEIPANGSGSVTLHLSVQAFSGVTPGDGLNFRGQLLILPNPSRGSVDVYLRDSPAADLSAQVFDARGRRVCTVTGAVAPGAGPLGFIIWDGLDQKGRPVASGVYTIQVTSDGVARTGKVAIVR